MQRVFGSAHIEVRRAAMDDAQAIGAVFDAAVRAGWTYLGELAQKPMFAPHSDAMGASSASLSAFQRTLAEAGFPSDGRCGDHVLRLHAVEPPL